MYSLSKLHETSVDDENEQLRLNKRALVLLNRNARHGEQAADEVVGMLKELGIDVLEAQPEADESLSALVVRHRSDVDLVIVGGGDGTLNAAIDGVIRSGLPLGIIPLGTANDLARTLAIPTEVEHACKVISDGHTRMVDVGEVNGKCFFNVASMGLSVDITRRLTKDVKQTWGVLAYLKTALQALYRARLFQAEIETGKETVVARTVQIAIGNGRHYGGGMTVCNEAEIDDQQLDFYSLEIRHWWQILFLLRRLRTGELAPSRYVRTMRGKSFTVRTRRPRSINTDGEITTKTPATFRVIPNALSLFVPANDDATRCPV